MKVFDLNKARGCVIDLQEVKPTDSLVWNCTFVQGSAMMDAEFRFLHDSVTLVSKTPEIPTVIDLIPDTKLTGKFLRNIVMNKNIGNMRKLFPAFKYLYLDHSAKGFGLYKSEYWGGPILIKDMSGKCVWDLGQMPIGEISKIQLSVIDKAHAECVDVKKFCKNEDFAVISFCYLGSPQKEFFVKPNAVLDLKFFELTDLYALPIGILQRFTQHTQGYTNILYVPEYLK